MSKEIRELLERPQWPEGVEPARFYEREGDGGDGLKVRVVVSADGDAYISTNALFPGDAARFCTLQGGGRSTRTRAALLMLAEAIRLDNEDQPQRRGPADG